MYSEEDLAAAVAAGIVSPEAARGLRAFVEQRRSTPLVDEERFRLLSGFNDIFVTIAIALLLVAVNALAGSIHLAAGGAAVAAASWGLAEYFTRRRRMALPSIVLLVSFVGGVFFTVGAFLIKENVSPAQVPMLLSLPALLAAVAAYAHWRRFMVPITVAAGAAFGLAAAFGALVWLLPVLQDHFLWLVFAGGLALFALAMAWDMRDRDRTTRATDVAFWLHLAAAPAIIHPVFASVGIGMSDDSQATLASAGVAIGVYVLLALISLAIDRRAMLVSALVYVLYAITAVFQAAGTVQLQFAMAALVIGSLLLLLSAGWHGARRMVIGPLSPGLRAVLPAV